MAVWPGPGFTSDIYPCAQPSEHTAFGCIIPRFGLSTDWDSEWCRELLNPLPYGRTALVEASVKDFGARSILVVVLLTLTTMLGCSALNASQPAAQHSTGLVATAA